MGLESRRLRAGKLKRRFRYESINERRNDWVDEAMGARQVETKGGKKRGGRSG